MAVSKIQNTSGLVALYTCELYTVLLGSRWGSVFVIDTHAVPSSAVGKNSGMVKFFKDSGVLSAAHAACTWLWQRFKSSGIKSGCPQSLAIMRQSAEISSRYIDLYIFTSIQWLCHLCVLHICAVWFVIGVYLLSKRPCAMKNKIVSIVFLCVL